MEMKQKNVAIITFPGTNCERDLYHAVSHVYGQKAAYVRHNSGDNLRGFDVIMIPGGSSYGDKIRPGAIAAKTPIMEAVAKASHQGKIVVGICNGFQILTQAGLLPGELVTNPCERFICKTVPIKIANTSHFTKAYRVGEVVNYPIAHLTGRYQCDASTLAALQQNNQIIFTYQRDVNQSLENIAGITNQAGNVMGLMPHPERALESILGNTDGRGLFESIFN